MKLFEIRNEISLLEHELKVEKSFINDCENEIKQAKELFKDGNLTYSRVNILSDGIKTREKSIQNSSKKIDKINNRLLYLNKLYKEKNA
jgi:hypothetical protein